MIDRLLIKHAAQIVTPEGNTARHGREMKQLKIYENQSILIENGKIRSIGNQPDWDIISRICFYSRSHHPPFEMD